MTPEQYLAHINNRLKRKLPVEVNVCVKTIKSCNIDELTVQDTVVVPTEIEKNGEKEVVYNTHAELAKWIVDKHKYHRQKAQH